MNQVMEGFDIFFSEDKQIWMNHIPPGFTKGEEEILDHAIEMYRFLNKERNFTYDQLADLIEKQYSNPRTTEIVKVLRKAYEKRWKKQ